MKYRIWHKGNKRYTFNDRNAIYLASPNNAIYRYSYNDEIEVVDKDNYIIEQSTGLKDINGKEIYVGDFVKVVELNIKGYVGYNNKNLTYCFTDDLNSVFRFNEQLLYEIIGNIHEEVE